jgi:serine/threonine-protein kinase RsbW
VTAPLRLYVRRSETPDPDSDARRVQISLRVPTDLDIVEETVDLVARHCLAGNRLDPTKRVEIRVEVGEERLSMHVRDEGDGFDPTQIPDPTEPERVGLSNGRGLFMIRQLVDEVHFNERGNAICMIMRRA